MSATMQPPQPGPPVQHSQHSQPSSQQSFSMSQPSSQVPASVYRQYTDPQPKLVNDHAMSIYSVRLRCLPTYI